MIGSSSTAASRILDSAASNSTCVKPNSADPGSFASAHGEVASI